MATREPVLRKFIAIMTVAAVYAVTSVSPVLAGKPTATIPPGTWHGTAYVTGGISGNQLMANLTSPSVYTFEFQVQPDGTVIKGLWNTNTANVSVNVPELGPAGGTISGGGSLGGNSEFVTAAGTYAITVSIPSLGVSGFPVEFPAAGGFQATTANCNTIYGDLATEARQQQQAAGYATSVMGPFTATRIAGPGEQGVPGWEQNYIQLLDKMDAMIKNPKPSAKEVLDLVIEIELFQANLVKAQSCPDLPKSFKKGKQPYTWFVEKYTELLNKLLDNPDAYSGSEIFTMMYAAYQIGALGSAAPDEQAAQELLAKFKQVLDKKIDADIAAGDKSDAEHICFALKQGSFKDLAAKACDFAGS